MLEKKLTYTSAYRINRLEVAHQVINHPETLPELLNYCLKNKEEVSYRAAGYWSLYVQNGWIYSELKIIIEQHINTKTTAYKARGKITINKIKKYRLKNLKA